MKTAEALKWELGTFNFAKVSLNSAIKRSPDQKEDRFKPQAEIKPVYKLDDIPKPSVIHYIFAMLVFAGCVFLFPTGLEVNLATLFNHSRLIMLWIAYVAFCMFCLVSWAKLNIFQTISYAPGAILFVTAFSINGLRYMHHLCTNTDK